ncbi:MAG: CoA transferase [Nitrososphaerota archaeon]|nr:CoA transferase [Nitrososphaerota archaeon]MDG7024236.1 CoA transferase [Nitrososphaerota archaeon]
MGFLDNVRVVDATRLLPGGFCTMLLSDMGAEVIKVEQPGLGDYMRATPPTKDGRSPVHSTVNRNKRSIGIDLKTAGGKRVMRRLLRTADVFIEGFRPGAMSRLGFSFQSVKKVNPKIIYCSISAYGQDVNLSSMPGHDINFQAMAGTLAYSSGAEVPLLQLGDLSSGMYAALGILGALASRRGPVYIDVPIVGSLLSWMVIPASAYLATGRPPKEGHSLVFGSTPYYNLYRTSDKKYMAVAAIEEGFWSNLLGALGVPQMAPYRFGTETEREEVTETLKRIFATKTRDEWSKALMHLDTCTTPVLTVEEALTSDWARSLKMLADLAGKETVLNSPVRSQPSMRGRAFTSAPGLGDDTESLMKSLGYSRSQTGALRAKGAIE